MVSIDFGLVKVGDYIIGSGFCFLFLLSFFFPPEMRSECCRF